MMGACASPYQSLGFEPSDTRRVREFQRLARQKGLESFDTGKGNGAGLLSLGASSPWRVLLTPENQQRILRATSQFANELCEAFDLGSFSHKKAVDTLRVFGPKTVFELLLALVKNTMPSMAPGITLNPEHFPEVLDAFETPEQAEHLLLLVPDEKAEILEGYPE
jgi:hypothetical protein